MKFIKSIAMAAAFAALVACAPDPITKESEIDAVVVQTPNGFMCLGVQGMGNVPSSLHTWKPDKNLNCFK